MKLRYKIKTNLIKEDSSSARINKAKTKTESNAKGLFTLTPNKSLFNGLDVHVINGRNLMKFDIFLHGDE